MIAGVFAITAFAEGESGSNEFKPNDKGVKDYLVTIVTDPLIGS